jgi:ABC-type nitrate/sulfonate/bicarbonate transport system substrate-binding protein
VATAYNEGQRVRIGMALTRSTDLILITKPGILRIADLAGKQVGFIGRNSDAYHILKWHLEKNGMDLEQQTTVVEVKSPATLVATFQSSHLDAIVVWGAYAAEAIDGGGVPFLTFTEALEETIGHPHYSNLVIISEALMSKPRLANSFLRAVRQIIGR